MTWKRIKRYEKNRFTVHNMTYTQAFIDYIQIKDHRKIKFMDEMGVKLTDAHSHYGHSERGTPCVEITRFSNQANSTVSALIGADGVLFVKCISGASNMNEFVQFFTEACEAHTDEGIPAIQPGDIIVVDNASIHHNDAEIILGNYFAQIGVDYVFLPTYSPDFNPCENCFSKIKTLLKSTNVIDALQYSLKLAVLLCFQEISAEDCVNFYRKTGYLRV